MKNERMNELILSPSQIGSFTELNAIKLSGTSISGTLPASLGKLQKLTYLEAHSCALTGTTEYLMQ